jgi:septal ring factor EnvC (AmiA/AmiB activator)
MTPEEQLISSNFSANRAKLPWPVSRGHIISYFGRQEHPSLRGVYIENNGLDIKTNTGADARSIFGGTVVNVFSLPTVQNCVIIRHGEFFTVYSNIQQVFVKPNQTVSAKEAIGKLFTDEDELTKVHIEIWRGKEKLDPSLWLAPN